MHVFTLHWLTLQLQLAMLTKMLATILYIVSLHVSDIEIMQLIKQDFGWYNKLFKKSNAF
jgi:hypothetical protein